MIAKLTLHNMKQDWDEPVRVYRARLRGQANNCKFTHQCTRCDAAVDYTEPVLRDVLCRGLEDTDIQMDLFGDSNQEMTLEQILKFVEAKGAGKRSASRLLLSQATMQWPAVHIESKKRRQSINHCQNTKIPAHTVGPRGTRGTLQQGSGEPNAQPTAPSAITRQRSPLREGVYSQDRHKDDWTRRCNIWHTVWTVFNGQIYLYAPGPPHLWLVH